MATCRKCGKKLRDDARFCVSCGTPVQSNTNINVNSVRENTTAQTSQVQNKSVKRSVVNESSTQSPQGYPPYTQAGQPNQSFTPNAQAGQPNPGYEVYTGAEQPNAGFNPYAQNAQQATGYNQHTQFSQPQVAPGNQLNELSGKIRLEAIIWSVVASLQIVSAIVLFFLFLDYPEGYSNLISAISLLVIAVLNIKSASSDFKYSKQILTNPVGIVEKYTPTNGIIATLIYNLLFGGLLGIVGSIFGFVTRNYVMSNINVFKYIEVMHNSNVNK